MYVVNTKLIYSTSLRLPSLKDGNVLYITDSNTTVLLKKSKNFDPSAPHIELEAGEGNKTFKSVEKILKKAMECGINRGGKFIGVGGGVILDMTGFASSIYMRGIQAIYVPTTLLAMVDASIGGKTGVDFCEVKNILGTFYLPKEVYICSDYLNSLDKVQYKSGMAEMLKIALLNRPTLYQKFAQHSKIKLSLNIELIKEAIEGKLEIVKSDFEEKGQRVNLNFGHTFAHSLEATLGFSSITHGEAVAWGIARSLSLGVLLGKTDVGYRDEVVNLLASLGYSTEAIPHKLREVLERKAVESLGMETLGSNGDEVQAEIKNAIANLLIEKMKSDKKNRTAKIRFVLQKKLGLTFTEEVDESYIREVLV